MKRRCPVCGYKDTPTMREVVRLWRVEFGELPILEMIQRGWIRLPADRSNSMPAIRDEVRRFFRLKDDHALTQFLADDCPLQIPANVCTIEPQSPPFVYRNQYQAPRTSGTRIVNGGVRK